MPTPLDYIPRVLETVRKLPEYDDVPDEDAAAGIATLYQQHYNDLSPEEFATGLEARVNSFKTAWYSAGRADAFRRYTGRDKQAASEFRGLERDTANLSDSERGELFQGELTPGQPSEDFQREYTARQVAQEQSGRPRTRVDAIWDRMSRIQGLAELKDDDFETIQEKTTAIQELKPSKAYTEWQEATGWEAAKKFFTSSAVLDMAMSGAGSSVQPMIQAIAGGAVAGPAGTAVGSGAGGFQMNYNAKLYEKFAEEAAARGLDINKRETIDALAADTEFMQQAAAKALKYGAAHAVFDTASGAIAGSAIRSAKAGGGSVAAGVAKDVAREGALEATGEAVATLAAGDELSGKELVEEAVGGAGMSAAQIGVNVAASKSSPQTAESSPGQQISPEPSPFEIDESPNPETLSAFEDRIELENREGVTTHREAVSRRLAEAFPKMSETEAEATSVVIDAAADTWGRFNQRPAYEWYEDHLGGIKSRPDETGVEIPDGDAIFQPAKGMSEWFEEAKGVITAFQDADATTALHEFYHVFEPTMPEPIHGQLREAYGVDGGMEAWTDENREHAARDFEAYMMTGKAPTPALQQVFDILKQAFAKVYESVKAIPGMSGNGMAKISPIFDQMLGDQPPGPTPGTAQSRQALGPEADDAASVSGVADGTKPAAILPPNTALEAPEGVAFTTEPQSGQIIVHQDNPEGRAAANRVAKAFPASTPEQHAELGEALGYTPEEIAEFVGDQPSGPNLAPGASNVREWRTRNAFARIATDEEIDPTIRENLGVPGQAPAGQYVPITNADTVEQVAAKIEENGLIASAQTLIDGRLPDGTPVDQVLSYAQEIAMAELVTKKLNQAYKGMKAAREENPDAFSENDLDQMSELTEDVVIRMAERGTEMGQGIQAFAMWSRLTPSGALRALVKRTRKKAAQEGKDPPNITDEQKERIEKLAEEAFEAPEGYLKNNASRKLEGELKRIEGLSTAEALQAMWYANILSGPNTHGINIFGSGFHLALRAMAAAAANPRDAGRMVQGMIDVAPQAFREGWGSLVDGREVARYDRKFQQPGVLEQLVNLTDEQVAELPAALRPKWVRDYLGMLRYVFRALQGPDAFFYRVGSEGRAYITASKIARTGKKEVVRSVAAPPEAFQPGARVSPSDRHNIGTVTAINGNDVTVHFVSPEGGEATKVFPRSELEVLEGPKQPTVREKVIVYSGPPKNAVEFAQRLADELHNTEADQAAALKQAKQDVQDTLGDPRRFKRDVHRRAYEILEQKRDSVIQEEAKNFGELANYTNVPDGALGTIAKGVNQIIDKAEINVAGVGPVKVLKFAVPFVNIVANVANASMDFTPVGYARAIKGSHIINPQRQFTDTERAELAITATMGAAGAATVAGLAEAFLDDEDPEFAVYAMGPPSSTKRRQMMSQGWRPYTIKVRDKYIKYNETPLTIMLSTIGAMHDAQRYQNSDAQRSIAERLDIFTAYAAKSYSEAGFLRSVADLMGMITGEKPVGAGFVGQGVQAAKGVIPVQGAIRDLGARPFDPTVYERDSLWGKFIADVPVVQGYKNRPMLNAFGEPVVRNDLDRMPIVSRFASKQTADPAWKFLATNDLWIPGMSKDVTVSFPGANRNQKAALARLRAEREQNLGRWAANVFTPEERYEYVQRAGKYTREIVERMMDLPPRDKETMQKFLSDQVQKARKRAKIEILFPRDER